MVSFVSVLCFEDDRHDAMMAAGVLSLVLIPLPFVACACYFVWHYPRFLWEATLRSEQASRFLLDSTLRSQRAVQAGRFLCSKYCPHSYFYGVALLFRSLALCLVPVVIRDDVALQILSLAAVLFFSVLLQQHFNPWRSCVANHLDGALNVSLFDAASLWGHVGKPPDDTGSDPVLGAVFVHYILRRCRRNGPLSSAQIR
jgi:hypothetical protein